MSEFAHSSEPFHLKVFSDLAKMWYFHQINSDFRDPDLLSSALENADRILLAEIDSCLTHGELLVLRPAKTLGAVSFRDGGHLGIEVPRLINLPAGATLTLLDRKARDGDIAQCRNGAPGVIDRHLGAYYGKNPVLMMDLGRIAQGLAEGGKITTQAMTQQTPGSSTNA